MKTEFRKVLLMGRVLFFGMLMSVSFSACGSDDDEEPELVIDPVQLATPTQAAQATVTESTATFTWNAVANASGYNYTLKDASSATVESNSTTATSVTFENLDFGATYTLEVIATTTDTKNYTNSGTATFTAETVNKVYIAKGRFYNSNVLSEFYADLYKKKGTSGEVIYYFENWMKDYNLEFTLDDTYEITFLNGAYDNTYGDTYWLPAGNWSDAYPLYLTAEEGYYIAYNFVYAEPGYNKLYVDGDPSWDNNKWGFICLGCYKYQDGDNENYQYDYVYLYISLE